MRYGINGSGTLLTGGVDAVLAGIDDAESAGFASYWVAQVGLTDALGLLGAHGNTGSSMQLGTAVISTWERHPHALAAQALTTQALVGDRLIVGIGVNHQPIVEEQLAMQWHKPVRHMADYLKILGELLEAGSADHDGQIWSFHGNDAKPSLGVPKVMIAALGEQMLRLAGRHAAGTVLWCVGPKTIRSHIAPIINEAAAEAGRPTPAIVCSIPVWVTDDPEPARGFLAQILANYAELPSYRAVMDREGVHGLGELSLVGSEEHVRDQLGQIADSGATDFTAVPLGGNPDEQARTMSVLTDSLASS